MARGRPAGAAAGDALDRVQEAAAIFRRSGVLPPLDGEEKRIFDAVVKPERVKVTGDVEAECSRVRKEIARSEGMLANERFVAGAPAAVVEAERDKLERYRRELTALATRPGRASATMADARTDLDWLASLSPWPEHFGLERMHRLLADLGEPQRAFAAIHVVGTNGKTSTTLMSAALLRSRDCASAPTSRRTSPAGPSGSRSTGATPTSSAPSPGYGRMPRERRSSRC